MVYSGAWGKLIHEKNQKSKISWQCPFKLDWLFSFHRSKVFFLFFYLPHSVYSVVYASAFCLVSAANNFFAIYQTTVMYTTQGIVPSIVTLMCVLRSDLDIFQSIGFGLVKYRMQQGPNIYKDIKA